MKTESLDNVSISETEPKAAVQATKYRKGSWLALLLFLAFALFIGLNFNVVVVQGPSMLPTFHTGQRLTVSHAYWLFGPIHDKDIVVFREKGKSDYIIKRVYKMAGEKVDYVNSPRRWRLSQGEFTVPAGDIYVLGDNRQKSEDSRYFGPVPLTNVIGKVIVYP